MRGTRAKKLRRLSGHSPSTQSEYGVHYTHKEVPVPVSENYPKGLATIRLETRVLAKGQSRKRYQSLKQAYRTDKPGILTLTRGLGL